MTTLIDDYNTRTSIYFLKDKYDAFTFFKQYKNQVEKETGSMICYMCTDREGEFTLDEFNLFCKETCITRQLI